MRVAHIAPSRTSESSAAWRILRAQSEIGIDVKALVHDPRNLTSASLLSRPLIPGISNYRLMSGIARVPGYLLGKTENELPWSPGFPFIPSGLMEPPTEEILHFHWLPHMLSRDLVSLESQKVVLTLHDVWPMTAGCHANLGCGRWETGCLKCPQKPKDFLGMAPRLFEIKREALSRLKCLAVVGPSEWIVRMARKSPMFENRRIHHVPNPIDLREFPLIEKEDARRELGLKPERRNILFSTAGSVIDYHKGLELLLEAVRRLAKSHNPIISIVGAVPTGHVFAGIEVLHLGANLSQEQMKTAYAASDVVAIPSRHDNFPSTSLEAQAMGRPVVGFRIGGVAETIVHGVTGYVATYPKVQSFGNGLSWAIKESQSGKALEARIRTSTDARFNPARVGQLYREVYESL